MDQRNWLNENCPSLLGKTVAITGATGGLGTEICRGILHLNGSLLLLCRSKEKADILISRLLSEFPQGKFIFFPLDLEDMGSIERACEYLKVHTPQILLHNAGIYDVPRHICSTGLDNIFQVNFFGPYYLTEKLLPELRAGQAHVAVVGSIAHSYSPTDPGDVDFHTKAPCHLAYGNSKRYLMFGFGELLKEESQVSFSIGHPGITLTNISDHYPPGLFPLIRPFLKLFFMKPETASRGILYGITHPMSPLTWVGPRFFHIWGNPGVKALKTCSQEERQQIFKASQKLYHSIL